MNPSATSLRPSVSLLLKHTSTAQSSRIARLTISPFKAAVQTTSSPSPPIQRSLNTATTTSSGSRSSQPPPPKRRLAPFAAAATLLAGSSFFFLTREEPPILAPDRWTSVKIQSVQPLTPETSLFRIEVPRSFLPEVLKSDPEAKPILSLFVKEPTLQIQRAYTPLTSSSFNPNGPAILDLVVKRYPDGEVSRYLHRLGPGDELSIRAPSVTWYYRPREYDEVVFIAGGTGVTPAYQLVHDTLNTESTISPSTSPALSLIYASPSPSRILLKQEIDTLKTKSVDSTNPFRVKYLVDRVDRGSKLTTNDMTVGFITKNVLEQEIGRKDPKKRVAIVVCGPEGMINVVAGPRGRNFSQGPVGGILRELGYTERDVIKL